MGRQLTLHEMIKECENEEIIKTNQAREPEVGEGE